MYQRNYDDDDNDGIFGTPFPALEADEIVSRKPEIDQTVRDERGRRRFHGAFTGGFSAGYWNTVGSAEGFTPKIFKSSRRDKYDQTGFSSKPEDFMDDEDFGSFGIAPKKIHTKDDFVENLTFGNVKDSAMTLDQAIRTVFEPSRESIGKRLFRKMKRNARLDVNNKTSFDDDTGLRGPKISYEPKINRHGLGYKGMLNPDDSDPTKKSASSIDSKAIKATLKSGKRLKISGEAFGYGALEDDDAMDIYGTDDMSQYDFQLGGPIQSVQKKPARKPFVQSDRIIELDGFRTAKEPFSLFVDIKKKYRTVEIPRGWKRPVRKVEENHSSSGSKKSRWDLKDGTETSTTTGKPEIGSSNNTQKVLNANVRAVILGENLIHRTGVARKSETEKPPEEVLEFNKEIRKPTPIATPVVRTPLSGYFASKFTRSATSAGDDGDLLVAGLNSFSSVTRSKMESTEDVSKEESQDQTPKEPVRNVYQWHPHKLLCKRFGVQNPYPQFPDMIGIVCMNREDQSRNMMARMNSEKLTGKIKNTVNIFETLNNQQPIELPTAFGSSKRLPSPPAPVEDSKTNKRSEPEQDEEEEAPPPEKPAMALFKSIFASDDDDDDDDDDSGADDNGTDKKAGNPEKCTNGGGDGGGGGIFSGIDFDQLSKNFDPKLKNATGDEKTGETERKTNEADSEEEFGPSLPPDMNILNSNHDTTESYLKLVYEKMKSEKKRRKKSNKKKIKSKKESKKRKKKKSDNRHHHHHRHGGSLKRHSKSSSKDRSSSSSSSSSSSFESE